MTVYTYLQRRKKMLVMSYLYNLEIVTTEDKISKLLKLKLWNVFDIEKCAVLVMIKIKQKKSTLDILKTNKIN